MIDFFVIVPFLFTVFIALMIGVAWVSFFRNLVDRNPQNRRSGTYSGSYVSRRDRNRSASQRQRRGRQQPVSSTQPAREAERQLMEDLLRQSPQDVARILKQYVPERYHTEIVRILASGDWRKELRSFIRRSDIWPIVRKALLTNPDTLRNGNKPNWDMSSSQGGEGTVGELAKQLELEYNELAGEYDRLLEAEFEDIDPILVERAVALEVTRGASSAGGSLPLKNREWLKQAILGSEILKRPGY